MGGKKVKCIVFMCINATVSEVNALPNTDIRKNMNARGTGIFQFEEMCLLWLFSCELRFC